MLVKGNDRKNPKTDSTLPPSKRRAESSGNMINPIDYWRKEGYNWPKKYFEPEGNKANPLAGSTTSFMTRKKKQIPYKDVRYAYLLSDKGSFMQNYEDGPKRESKDLCQKLLKTEQIVPDDSCLSSRVFDLTCEGLCNRNEEKTIQDISRLIVPSAEKLANFGAVHLKRLVESVNKGWSNSIPLIKPRPRPDYSVGFTKKAFSKDQLYKLRDIIGDVFRKDPSYLMATSYMYFPFLTCEVSTYLEIADRQNTHNMTLAVRGIVKLFKLMKREDELHQEILAFSISHDDDSVKIYGHYPVIDKIKTTIDENQTVINKNKITFYRHVIRAFSLTDSDGKEKWTAYKFIMNLYDIWVPAHFKRICSVIDELPRELDLYPSSLSFIGS